MHHQESVEQLTLFSNTEFSSKNTLKNLRYLPPINCNKVLLESKSRIFEFQQDEKENNLIRRQTKLFDITSLPCECQLDPDTINPLTLPLQPLNFATEVNQFDNACIYFILDKALPLILYIGQSKNCCKRLRTLNYSSSGAHHRKKQIESYQQLNQNYGFSSSIYIARWDLPILLEEKYRLELEKSLILKWYPLFNQQNQESILWSNYLVKI